PQTAQKPGRFKDDIVPSTVKTRKGDVVVDSDEHPKHGTTLETIAKLRPAFANDRTVSAANASGINDDAARAHRRLGPCRGCSLDHGHRANSGIACSAQASRLERRRSRPRRSKRG